MGWKIPCFKLWNRNFTCLLARNLVSNAERETEIESACNKIVKKVYYLKWESLSEQMAAVL
jgi:hypothetical protein